jgi:integrase
MSWSAFISTSYSKTNIPAPPSDLAEFARWTARRISEICRLRWDDIDETNRTCVIRGLVSGRDKKTWDHEFPVLGKAWEIIQRQPRVSERIFPHNAKSAGARYTRAKADLGIKDLRFNDLRREAAKQLLKEGYKLEQVLKVVGRVDTRSLMRELGLTSSTQPLTR